MEKDMSVIISFTYDQLDQGVSQGAWASFCADFGLAFSYGSGLWNQGRIEADYESDRSITFRTTGGFEARSSMVVVAMNFWRKFSSGKLYASQELMEMIADLVTQSLA
jgi:hypothetical protein